MVKNILMEILTTRVLFAGVPADGPHAHIIKLNYLCKSCISRPELNMNFIELRVFPLSLTGYAAIWFNEILFNSICTLDQLTNAFPKKIFLGSKKLNKKDKLNNFVAQPGQSVSSSWDRFIAFMRGVPNHYIDDESLKEYFYRGQDDNGKEVLDKTVGSSYDEWSCAHITEKIEKISHNNKLGALECQTLEKHLRCST